MKRQSKLENKYMQNPVAGNARRSHRAGLSAIRLLFALLLFAPAAFAQQVFTGASTAETASAATAFRAAVTGAGATVGTIGWDGVRLDGTDNNGNTTPIVAGKITGIPVNRFQVRGVIFNGITAVANDGFVSANAGVADQFPAFSPANTFAAFNSNKIELNFVVPSAPTTAPIAGVTRGFGVVFLDVERANTSGIEYFNGTVSLGKYFVPAGASGQAQFLGVLFSAPVVTRVVITTGTAALFNFNNGQTTPGAPDQTINAGQNTDQVATDDFIIADPVAGTTGGAAFAFSGVGTTEATTALATFRITIGGADNSTVAGPQTSGRREINWDGVRLDGTDFNNVTTPIVPNKITGIPVNRFQARGARFDTVLAVSNDGFVSANAAAADQFPAFSAANTFASFNSNKYAVDFVLAGTSVPAATRGFGAIFLDVEQANTSSIEYFNGTVSLGKFFVPAGQSGQAEFLGVFFNAPVVTRVVITTGTAQIFNFSNGQVTAGASESATTDLVALDDFVYGEPLVNSTSVSSASFTGAALASEAITSVFGDGLATGTVIATATPLPTTLAGTSITVRDSAGVDRLAPLFFVSSGQINYLIPSGTATGDATITVTSGDGRRSTGRARIEAVAPGLFTANSTGQGVAAAVVLRIKANGDRIYETISTFDAAQQRFVATPIDLGPESDAVYLILYGTGIRFRSGLSGVTATIGAANAGVSYAGGDTGLIGLDQINVLLPRSLAGRGEVDVILTVDGKAANTVKINVK
ncbi:MAG: hypothetical protein ABI977_11285 [Acidobacteriota bacterium]